MLRISVSGTAPWFDTYPALKTPQLGGAAFQASVSNCMATRFRYTTTRVLRRLATRTATRKIAGLLHHFSF